ncbi:class I SAM-dependent methyltransferase [Sediminitomix flava]|nr:class I SAM-dependent methyltransferase [Sediminitomix flava]
MKNECENYMASQFFVDKPLGMIVNGFRNEDLEQQTFEDHEFDIIITQDVMEHVYEPEKAFKEIARTLKTGGAHIFTVPIINKHFETEQWAVKGENNNPIFLKEAEYHGNPIDPQGSPVTYHWGYDIVDFIQQTSNLETSIEYINNIELGIRAEYIEVLISKKL